MAANLNVPELRRKCSHGGHARTRVDARTLARWPWGVMQILADKLCELWHSPDETTDQNAPARCLPPPGIARPMHPDL
eukprot:3194173-Amphidinium_carterae.1